jgi:hypothetical protein
MELHSIGSNRCHTYPAENSYHFFPHVSPGEILIFNPLFACLSTFIPQFAGLSKKILEHAGELRIIVLIEEERVIHRPNTPHTRAH